MIWQVIISYWTRVFRLLLLLFLISYYHYNYVLLYHEEKTSHEEEDTVKLAKEWLPDVPNKVLFSITTSWDEASRPLHLRTPLLKLILVWRALLVWVKPYIYSQSCINSQWGLFHNIYYSSLSFQPFNFRRIIYVGVNPNLVKAMSFIHGHFSLLLEVWISKGHVGHVFADF